MSSPLATPIPDAALDELIHRLAPVMPEPEILANWPILEQILSMKAEQDAVIVAHNYQVPLITAGVADFVGDSLAMARFAATSRAGTIIVCGAHFMAETVKLLCPDKRVLLPSLNARCSLADSINVDYVRALKSAYPGLPVVAYVNTPAAVKAEADICCTSANAVEVARRLGVPVLAHPECPEDVQGCADFVGSTSGMIQYLRKSRPRRVLLLTECSMADNVSIDLPDIEFLRPCNLCSYMKSITILGIAHTLEDGCHEIEVAPQIAVRARRAVQRMLDV